MNRKIARDAEFERVARISLKNSIKDEKTHLSKEDLAPPDPYHLVHIIFFCFGLAGTLPPAFFTTAQDYWMYKFRNTTSETVDLMHKTTLQANFTTLSSTATAIPGLITTLIANRYGHKINIRYRILATMVGTTLIFVVFTALIKVNTDSWQIEFFVLTITVIVLMMVCGIFQGTAMMALNGKFPISCMKAQIYGTSLSGVFSSALQIMCLYIGGSTTTVALIYFSIGTTVIAFGAVAAYVTKYIPAFRYYLGDVQADTTRPTQTLAQMKDTALKIWPFLIGLIISMLFGGMGYPNITVLIVSEDYGKGNVWNDKYFEPTITFLWYNVVGLVVKFWAKPMLTAKIAKWWVLFDTTKTILLGPLFMFCNARPRKNLPVLFPHDWQYILILTVNVVLNQFMATCGMISMQNFMGKDAEQGFLLLGSLAGVLGTFSSLISPIWVNIL